MTAQWREFAAEIARRLAQHPAYEFVRAALYAAVGDYIARRSHLLILLWDGHDNEKVGGTAWVKKRRHHWEELSKTRGAAPPVYGYAGQFKLLLHAARTRAPALR